MKKLLLSLLLVLAFGSTQAQNIYAYGFGGVTADLDTAGWVRTNQSTLASTTLWGIANYASGTATATNGGVFQDQTYTAGQTYPIPNGQDGTPNGFALVNYTSSTSTSATGATLSNWLITPTINVQNGDVVSFYTRLGKYSATGTASYPDNLELRMSPNGDFTANPSTGPTDLGDFTVLCVAVNPTLNLTAYPVAWTQYTYTVSGLTGATDAKFAFRYYVTDGGPAGNNSDIIGIDTFSVDRTLATQQFFNQNFAVYPNPATDVLNISSKNGAIKAVAITDINGRTVKTINGGDIAAQISIADLNAGVYFVKATSDAGTGTTKIVKN